MSNKTSDEHDPLAAAEKIMSAIEGLVRILGPLQSDERVRAIQGTLVVLRESMPPIDADPLSARSGESLLDSTPDATNVSPRARVWMRQNGLTSVHLNQVFDVSNGVATLIAPGVSGKNAGEKTIKAYVLAGIGSFIASGDPNFLDKVARSSCEELGFYDNTNHAKYLKGKGNYFVGDKDKGWRLTAPGLKYGAAIVKELASSSDA